MQNLKIRKEEGEKKKMQIPEKRRHYDLRESYEYFTKIVNEVEERKKTNWNESAVFFASSFSLQKTNLGFTPIYFSFFFFFGPCG